MSTKTKTPTEKDPEMTIETQKPTLKLRRWGSLNMIPAQIMDIKSKGK